jgi:hypothetical protein
MQERDPFKEPASPLTKDVPPSQWPRLEACDHPADPNDLVGEMIIKRTDLPLDLFLAMLDPTTSH